MSKNTSVRPLLSSTQQHRPTMHCTYTQSVMQVCCRGLALFTNILQLSMNGITLLPSEGRNGERNSSSGRRQHTDRQKVAKEVKQSKRTMQWLEQLHPTVCAVIGQCIRQSDILSELRYVKYSNPFPATMIHRPETLSLSHTRTQTHTQF